MKMYKLPKGSHYTAKVTKPKMTSARSFKSPTIKMARLAKMKVPKAPKTPKIKIK